ncbi:MAG TPA: restriction endonuclease, partial [Abditibacterium sp.]
MPRKGRFLEVLVERLEAFLSMEGIVVKSPEIFFKDGKIIGEIDITLRGNFGSSRIFIGVECRDRPSDGLQGIDWIRTIYGKQQHLKVDKMIAVSSTGFTDDAVELATQWKIDLLVFSQDELGHGNFKDWLKVATIPIIVPSISYKERVHIVTRDTFIRSNSKNIPVSSVSLHRPGTAGLLSLDNFINPEVTVKGNEFFDLDIDTWDANIVMDGPFGAEALGRPFTVDKVVVPLRFTREIVQVKMVINVYKRLNDSEIVAMSGVAQVKIGDTEF